MLNPLRNVTAFCAVMLCLLCSTAYAQERNASWKVSHAILPSASYEQPLTFNTWKNRVKISFTGTENENISHYILEQSSDGTNFRQIALFFTEERAVARQYEFSYAVPATTCYYRLAMVSKSGKIVRSNIQAYNTAKQ
jgi:hypothetical protein